MAMTPNVVSLPAVGSVDERSEDKSVMHPRLAQDRNVSLEKGRGAINKRLRFTPSSNGAGAPMFERGTLFDAIDVNLLCQTRKRVLRADGPTSHKSFYLAKSSNGNLYVSYQRYNTLSTSFEWRVACLDPDTYEQLNDWDDETPLSTPTGTTGRLFARSDGVVALWQDGANIKCQRANDDVTGWVSSPSTLVTDCAGPIAVCQKNETTAWFVYVTTSGAGDVRVMNFNLATLGATEMAKYTGSTAFLVDIYYDASEDDVFVAVADSVSGTFVYKPSTLATRALDATHTSGIRNIAIGRMLQGTARVLVVYDYETTVNPWLYAYGLPYAITSVDLTHEAMAQYVDSKIVWHTDSAVPLFVTRHAPDGLVSTTRDEATRFLTTIGNGFRFEPVAIMSPGIAVSSYEQGHLANIIEDGSGDATKFWWPGQNYVAPKEFDGAFSLGSANQADLSLYKFDFSLIRQGVNLPAHGMHVIAGGLPMFFDGSGYEAWPLHPPTIYDINGDTGGGSLTTTSTYQWIAVYEMFDNRGRVWRSAPSKAASLTLVSTENQAEIEVYVPVSRIQGSGRYPIRVILYRNTQSQPTLFQRVVDHTLTTFDNADWNIQSTPWVSWVDGFGDTEIDENEILYTQGDGGPFEGALPDHPAPPCLALEVHRRRLWAIDSETGNLWYSKLFVPGEGIRFVQSFQVQNPFPDELPTAIVSTESSLVVFYEGRIGQVFGDGPDDLGQGGQFSEIEFLPTEAVGAISQRLVEKTPVGVFFLDTNQGPMLLPYGGNPQPIGNESWPYTANFSAEYSESTHRGVDWLEDRNEVRFVEVDGGWRAYHIDQQVWSVGTLDIVNAGYSEIAQTLVKDGRFHVMVPNSSFHLTEVTSGGPYWQSTDVQVYETGWITLANLPGVQGLFRLWDIFFLGDLVGCRITLAYDWDENDTYEFLVPSQVSEQVRLRPNRQRIQALKITIEEGTISGGVFTLQSTNSGWDLTEIQLHFGVAPVRGRRPWIVQPAGGGG